MFFGESPSGHGDDARKRDPHGSSSSRFYELLELERDASAADIKKAYRKLAVQHHPDKGGDPERFKEITCAYEVLADEEKRRLYDERGEESVLGGTTDPADIFAMFFGGGAATGGRGHGRRKTKDIIHPLSVTLQQIYTGCTRKLAINREIVDKDSPVRRCEDCNGTGLKGNDVCIGLMLPPVQTACKTCAGTGRIYKLKKERELVEVFVDKGVPHSHRIVLTGKADEQPDCDPGDVIFIVHQQEHQEFQRRGADLYLAREIGLLDALTGFRMVITHLDERQFVVKTTPGEVVQPLAEGTGLKAVIGEGMPTYRNPFLFGNLFLVLTIKFPDAIDPAAVTKLQQALPGPPEPEVIDDSVEVCYLEDMDPVESAKAHTVHATGEAYEEDKAGGSNLPPGCPHQ